MIERYTRPEMAKIWDDRTKFLKMLEVETAVCRALASRGVIPRRDWSELSKKLQALIKKGGVDPKRVAEIERVTRHDTIAFTTAVAEKVGPTARWFHFGLTSSDALDTGFALQILEAGALLDSGVHALLQALKRRAKETIGVATIGRSHGIFAEPTAFGLKFAGWMAEWTRNRERLRRALDGVRFGKLSGAVGVNAHWEPEFETKILKDRKFKKWANNFGKMGK
jgi:adenylosuccinate lyase